LGTTAEEAVFVGDNMRDDIEGAQQCGMRAIYKPSPFGHPFYGGCTPDGVVKEIGLLPALLGIH
jgi:FMN hydrolase / 5-amino-6-(5-phospho-D-ribitylamino)uracil phosphatase